MNGNEALKHGEMSAKRYVSKDEKEAGHLDAPDSTYLHVHERVAISVLEAIRICLGRSNALHNVTDVAFLL